MAEKEIIIDLSKKIKFSDKLYISLGSLLLSTLILIVQAFSWGWSWGLCKITLTFSYWLQT